MGTDKSLLRLYGKPFVEHAVDALSSSMSDVVVIADDRARFSFLSRPVIPDRIRGCGPLGGIYTALSYAEGLAVFILACDMPLVTDELVRSILDVDVPTVTRVPLVDDTLQPLCALYGREDLLAIEADILRGALRIVSTLTRIRYTAIPLNPHWRVNGVHLLQNVNTPQEYRALVGEGADPSANRWVP